MEGTLSMDADRSDEERMRRRAAGRLEAFAPLRSRYSLLIHAVVARSLDRAAAKEISQELILRPSRRRPNHLDLVHPRARSDPISSNQPKRPTEDI
jgi:hypothetical protein